MDPPSLLSALVISVDQTHGPQSAVSPSYQC